MIEAYFTSNSTVVDTVKNEIFFYSFSSDDHIINERPETYRIATEEEKKYYERNRGHERIIKLPEQEEQRFIRKSYYGSLQETDIARAINEMVELAMPRFTKDKVLTISIEMSLDNFKGKHERHDIKFVFYRASNYTFVGAMVDDDSFSINEESVLEFLSYHDSCWREATGSKIAQMAQEMSDKYDEVKEMHVHTSFGVFGTGFVDGNIDLDSTNRKASFVKLEKK